MSLFLAILFSFSPGLPSAKISVTSACHDSTSWSSQQVNFLTRIVTRTDAAYAARRASLDLPFVTTAPAVELVTDENECANAVLALNAFYGDSLSHTPVYLFRIGTTRYAISDGSDVHIFDTNYQYKFSYQA